MPALRAARTIRSRVVIGNAKAQGFQVWLNAVHRRCGIFIDHRAFFIQASCPTRDDLISDNQSADEASPGQDAVHVELVAGSRHDGDYPQERFGVPIKTGASICQ